jgi:hypothetical protein
MVLFAYGCSFTHPLNPPLKQACLLPSILMMFERGKYLERGLRPLSTILPSPAKIIGNKLQALMAGEGSGVRRQLPTKTKQNLKHPLLPAVEPAILYETLTEPLRNLYYFYPCLYTRVLD